MTKVKNATPPIINDNLKHLAPFKTRGQIKEIKAPSSISNPNEKNEIGQKAQELNQKNNSISEPPTDAPVDPPTSSHKAESSASAIAKALSKIPTLPITIPLNTASGVEKKISDVAPTKNESFPLIEKPIVVFIEGFSPFGVSNGNGIKEMADNYPDAKYFSWNDKNKIHDLIKKHDPHQPLILVGHSFGADTAIEVANELNTPKNHFRSVDLIVSLDAVGINKTVIPVNVKKNLNYFVQGIIPFLHGDPTVAKNNKYTEVINELKEGLHSRIDDSPEIQFEIYHAINDVVLAQEQSNEMIIELDYPDLMTTFLGSILEKR